MRSRKGNTRMSNEPAGPDWWKAADGRWYPPEQWTGPEGTFPPLNLGFQSLSEDSPGSGPEEAEGRGRITMRPVLPWYRRAPFLLAAGVVLFAAGFIFRAVIESDGDEVVTVAEAASTADPDCPAGYLAGSSGCVKKRGMPTTSTTTQPTTSTTSSTTTTTAAPYVPTPGDFTVGVIEVERSCFGSAGCNVTFRPDPKYNGPPLPAFDRYTVVYEVHGSEDPTTKSFEFQGGEATFREVRVGTPPGGTLSATVVQVLPG